MISDNPDAGESKQMMKNPKYKEAVKMYHGAMKESVELTEDPSQEKPMMMGALRAMSHNMMGIAKYVQSTNDPEEWFQNKLAGVAKEMQTLYSYATAETMTGMATEETVVENKKASLMKKLAKASAGSEKGKKAVTLKKAPWEKKEETELTDEELSAKQKKIDHNKNGKIDGHDLAMLRNKKKKTEAACDSGSSKKVRKEDVDLLDEAMKFKPGAMKLKDGSQVVLKKEDANALTAMFKDLSRQNQKKLGEVAKKDKSGFEEILGFAREAL
jgi:plastocyanin